MKLPLLWDKSRLPPPFKGDTEVFKNYEEVIALSKDNAEAVVKANTLFVNGVQDFNKEIFAKAQATLKENAVMTKLVGVISNSILDRKPTTPRVISSA